MKEKFNLIMSIFWAIVSVIAGMYSVMNGGAMAGDSMTDPSVTYIAASFGIPGLFSVLFGFCKTVEDIIKLKDTAKEIIKK